MTQDIYSAFDPFRACQQEPLTAVLWRDGDEGETILLIFGVQALSLTANPEIDVLSVSSGAVGDTADCDDLSADMPWSRFIGKPFFWGWLTLNQQGRTDDALISFDGVLPEVGVNVVASSLETMLITRVSA